jgi:hypothetical protein
METMKVTIPANKYVLTVLAISSPAFEAMFYGQLAETGTNDRPTRLHEARIARIAITEVYMNYVIDDEPLV